MRLKWHIVVSLTVGFFSLFFNQKTPVLIVIGVFIDIDHIIDFWINHRDFSKSLQEKFEEGKMFVVFHGFENIFVLIMLSTVNQYLIFPAISYCCHLVIDAYSNKVDFWAYSYIARFGRRLTIHSASVKNILEANTVSQGKEFQPCISSLTPFLLPHTIREQIKRLARLSQKCPRFAPAL